MEQVAWKVNGIFKADPQKVYEEIGDTNISPEEVLNKARNKKSELHKCFIWDDSIAAEKYRLGQARQIIQLLVVKPVEEVHTPVRVYQITSERNVYQPTRLFMEQPDEYKVLLERAKGELRAIKERYKILSELETIFEAIDEL